MMNNKLKEAYDNHAYSVMEDLLGKGANPDTIWDDTHGRSLLILASFTDDIRAFNLLIKHGANIAFTDKHKLQPLHYAAKKDSVRCIEALIELGADIEGCSADRHTNTPLTHSISEKAYAAFDKLLELGADLNKPIRSGFSPLMVAARAGNEKAAKSLIERGANVDWQNDSNRTALHIASDHGHSEIVQLLLDGGVNIHLNDSDGVTPMMLAVEGGHLGCLRKLIDTGIDLDAADINNHHTALMLAVMDHRKESFKLLLEHGANIDKRSSQNQTLVDIIKNTYGRIDQKEIEMQFLSILEDHLLSKTIVSGHTHSGLGF